MDIVVLLNQKGGVGKSSTCHHLAGTLALQGKRVLLVDNDPQSSLSQGIWGPVEVRALDPSLTLAAVYAGEAFPEQVIRPTTFLNVDMIPGSRVVAESNVPKPYEAPWDSQTCLRDFLEPLRGSYDVCLIDSPPNLGLCSWAGLVAADAIVIPLQAEDYGSQGTLDVQDTIDMVVAGPNPSLHILGYLITMYNARRTVHQVYNQQLRAQHGEAVFDTTVPYATDFPEAIAHRKPVGAYKPRGAAARAMNALADEFLYRLSHCATRTVGAA